MADIGFRPRRSSLSERIQRVFTLEKSTDVKDSHNRPTAGRRHRLSFSEHVQQVFHREKPEPPSVTQDSKDCASQAPAPGSRRSSFSEQVQWALRYGKLGGTSVSRDPVCTGRDVNLSPAKKLPTQRNTSRPQAPSLSSHPISDAGVGGNKEEVDCRTAATNGSVSTAPSMASGKKSKQTPCQSNTDSLSKGSSQSSLKAPQREKRVTIRLETERAELKKRMEKLEETERIEFQRQISVLREAERKGSGSFAGPAPTNAKKRDNPAGLLKKGDKGQMKDGQERKLNGFGKEARSDTSNGTTVPQNDQRPATRQSFFAVAPKDSRPPSVRSDSSRSSSRFSSARFTSIFSSRATSRSRSNSSTWENISSDERPSIETSVTGTVPRYYLPLDLFPGSQEPFMKTISMELEARKDSILTMVSPTVPELTFQYKHQNTKGNVEYDFDEEYFTADEFD